MRPPYVVRTGPSLSFDSLIAIREIFGVFRSTLVVGVFRIDDLAIGRVFWGFVLFVFLALFFGDLLVVFGRSNEAGDLQIARLTLVRLETGQREGAEIHDGQVDQQRQAHSCQ